MYHRYYGLSRPPFAVTPDPAIFYMSKLHREALATIIYGVEMGKGFITCTGEVGTGKTTVTRAFCDQAPANQYKILHLFMPQILPEQLMSYICHELGVEDPRNENTLVQRLRTKLLDLYSAGRTAILLIDEAQHLSANALEFLRLISNLETDSKKLLQIILVGQPEFDEMLARHDMRQVDQRVALRARLGPLDREERLKYIDHRLRATGALNTNEVLSSGAACAIAKASQGIPRLINILADNVLISGFGLEEKPVSERTARRVVTAFIKANAIRRPGWLGLVQRMADDAADRSRLSPRRLRRRRWIGISAATCALGLLAGQVSLTDSIAAARLFAMGLFAQGGILSHVGDYGSQEARPIENAVTAPETHGEPTLRLRADQPPLTPPESRGAFSTVPLPAVPTQPPPVGSDAGPPVTAPTPSTMPATPTLSAADIAALVARGDELLRRKDIVSALLYYQRAAEAGDERAALLMVRATSDPKVLDRRVQAGSLGNPGDARFSYRPGNDSVPGGERRSEVR